MSEFKIGDRVKPKPQHDTFSAGEVVGFIKGFDGYMKVKFDVTPPKEYSMCENPTLVVEEWFQKEAE